MRGLIARHTVLVIATLTSALLLTILPMPLWAVAFRPQWVALLLIFWLLMLPERIGVLWSFWMGLLLDVISGCILGQHALSFSVMGYVVVELQHRLQLFRLWQQAAAIWLLLTLERLLSLWILGAVGQPTPALSYWFAPIVGTILWPWLVILLRDLIHAARR